MGFMNEFVADPYIWSEHGYGFRLENSFLALRKAGARISIRTAAAGLKVSAIIRIFTGKVIVRSTPG